MIDLTLIYYTANRLREFNAKKIRESLLEVSGNKYPVISVSQKPIDFGMNICVGEIGFSYYNCYKQILTGAKEADTEYVACCEDDIVYNDEHFSYRPSLDAFAYNTNLWFAREKFFWKKESMSMGCCIAPKALLVNNLESRFVRYPTEPSREGHGQKFWVEPGLTEKHFGIPKIRLELFTTDAPVVVLETRGTLGGKRRDFGYDRFYCLEPFGDIRCFFNKYWSEGEA